MSPKLLVRAKVNNGSMSSSNSIFVFLLWLLLDTALDDDERACNCKVKAKLYMTIIRSCFVEIIRKIMRRHSSYAYETFSCFI